MREALGRAGIGQRIFAGVIGLFFAAQFLMALRYPTDAKLFPLIVSAAGFLLALAPMLGLGLHEDLPDDIEAASKGKILLTLLVSPVYGVALWLLGYWLATLVAIPTVSWLLGYRKPAVLGLVTILVTLAIGFLFPLLGVPLPDGILPELVGL